MTRFFSLLITAFIFCSAWGQKSAVEIVFDKPSEHFTQSLPLGNGRLGAMPFGETDKQRILLNEISMWSGGKNNSDSPNAHQYLKPIQQLLLEGRNFEAQQLLEEHFVTKGDNGSCHGRGRNCYYGSFQMLAWLNLQWQHKAEISNYRRVLNLEEALATTSYKRNESQITERMFADFENDILWLELKSTEANIEISLEMERPENASFSAQNNQIIMQGQLTKAHEKGLRFVAVTEVFSENGVISEGNSIKVNPTDRVLIKISAVTNYNFSDGELTNENLLEKSQNLLKNTQHLSFETALTQSQLKYGAFFNRNRWEMPDTNPEAEKLTTWQRLWYYYEGKPDNQLPILYYNFGRYLLISSSKEGFLPANLQGLWADSVQCPWNGDYHLNINVQMNYWLAEQTNLSELAEPLHRFTKNLVPNGRKTAAAYYNASGWVAHVISNPWFFTSPGERAIWGSTLTGGAWLCQHIWEHYSYNKNIDFLREYYPVMKEAALFLQNILITDPKTGYLVTSPSNSPENTYKFQTKDGKIVGLNTCMGPTMDSQIIRELLSNLIKASQVLNVDKQLRKEWKKIIGKTAPNTIGKNGDLNEWLEDWDDAEPLHRHISHLYGLHPYDEITPWDTPKLAQAAEKTLRMRGDSGTGWSRAWKINFWARLGNGNHALKLFRELLKPVSSTVKHPSIFGGGTYENLFCAHPPFQIDGNFGGTAGLAEMLLQSQGKNNVIRFLPALPSEIDWKSGTLKGMKARNGFVVNMTWDDWKIREAEITSQVGEKCFVLLPAGKSVFNSKGKRIAKNKTEKAIVVKFSTKKNEKFIIK